MSIQIAAELLIAGITLGGLYALMGFALSLVLATTQVLNIAHGGFLVVGGALGMLLAEYFHLPFLVILPAFIVAGLSIGVAFELGLVRPILGKPPEEMLIGSILITFGFALALEVFLAFYWAKIVDPHPSFSLSFFVPSIYALGITFPGNRLIILGFASVMVLLFHLMLKHTQLGKAARAMSQDSQGALILGINPHKIALQIFATSTLATIVAGALYTLTTPLEPYSGFRLTLIALTIVVIGGVGSLPGALAGGLLLGISEVITAFFTTQTWSPVVYLLVFFLVLMVRPEGLMGRRRK